MTDLYCMSKFHLTYSIIIIILALIKFRLFDIQPLWCTATGEWVHEQTEARVRWNVQLLAPAAAPIAHTFPAAAARCGRPARVLRRSG